MAIRQFDAVAEIQSAFSTLTKNWMLAVPTAVSSLVWAVVFITILGSALAAMGLGGMGALGSDSGTGIMGAIAALAGIGGIGVLVAVLVSIVATAAAAAAAQDVWSGAGVDLGRAVGRALACLLQIILAGLILFICCVVVAITFVGPFILAFLMMYVLPAIVVGNAGATDAIGQSWNLTTKNFGPSIVAFIAILLVGLIGGFVGNLFIHTGPLWVVVSAAINALTAAFAALVSVRFYDLLRAGVPTTATVP